MFTHLYELVEQRTSQYPTAVAVGGQNGLTWQTLTSQQLFDLVDRLAVELATRLSIEDGDRVVLWVPNALHAPDLARGSVQY